MVIHKIPITKTLFKPQKRTICHFKAYQKLNGVVISKEICVINLEVSLKKCLKNIRNFQVNPSFLFFFW